MANEEVKELLDRAEVDLEHADIASKNYNSQKSYLIDLKLKITLKKLKRC